MRRYQRMVRMKRWSRGVALAVLSKQLLTQACFFCWVYLEGGIYGIIWAGAHEL